MRAPLASTRARLTRVLRGDTAALGQGFVALAISSVGDLAAGLTLGSISHKLEDLPGLIILIPAAIGMRGNVFGALGSRLSTTIHRGTFRLSRRLDTVVGQNLAASLALSLSMSLSLGVLAKAVAEVFGVANAISIGDFVVISVIAGLLSSAVLAAVTVGVAVLAAERSWDLDNVAAPLITAVGDVVTLPALFAATFLAERRFVTSVLGIGCAVVGVVAAVWSLQAGLPILRRIARESIPVLVVAGIVDLVAGSTLEERPQFLLFPALLIMVPPFLEDSGALGGILSARLATGLHLGTVEAHGLRLRGIGDDVLRIYVFAAPVFLLVGVSSATAAAATGVASPGTLELLGVALIGGLLATTAAIVVAVFATLLSHRFGFDPDNHGVPAVTSSLDLLGALSLIVALFVIGVA